MGIACAVRCALGGAGALRLGPACCLRSTLRLHPAVRPRSRSTAGVGVGGRPCSAFADAGGSALPIRDREVELHIGKGRDLGADAFILPPTFHQLAVAHTVGQKYRRICRALHRVHELFQTLNEVLICDGILIPLIVCHAGHAGDAPHLQLVHHLFAVLIVKSLDAAAGEKAQQGLFEHLEQCSGSAVRVVGADAQIKIRLAAVALEHERQSAGATGQRMEHHGKLVHRELVLLIDQLRDTEELHVFQPFQIELFQVNERQAVQDRNIAFHHLVIDHAQAVA